LTELCLCYVSRNPNKNKEGHPHRKASSSFILISYPASSFYGRKPTKKQYLKTSFHPPFVSLGSILLYP
jgi:hypothetical protein